MDAPVEVKAKDGDPGEVAKEDKIEEVAQETAHVVPRQSVGCKFNNVVNVKLLTNITPSQDNNIY